MNESGWITFLLVCAIVGTGVAGIMAAIERSVQAALAWLGVAAGWGAVLILVQ